jgi:hypothetical protein
LDERDLALTTRDLARTTPYRRSVEAGDFSTAELELRDATAARLAACGCQNSGSAWKSGFPSARAYFDTPQGLAGD